MNRKGVNLCSNSHFSDFSHRCVTRGKSWQLFRFRHHQFPLLHIQPQVDGLRCQVGNILTAGQFDVVQSAILTHGDIRLHALRRLCGCGCCCGCRVSGSFSSGSMFCWCCGHRLPSIQGGAWGGSSTLLFLLDGLVATLYCTLGVLHQWGITEVKRFSVSHIF